MKSKKNIILLIPNIVYVSVFNIVLSIIIAKGIDIALSSDKGNIYYIIVVLLFSVPVFGICKYLVDIIVTKIEGVLVTDKQAKIIDGILASDYVKLKSFESTNIVGIMYNECEEASKVVSNFIIPLITIVFSIVIGGVYIFLVSWQIGLIIIVLLPIFYFYNKYLSLKINEVYPKFKVIDAKVNLLAKEFFENILIVKIFDSKNSLIKKYEYLSDKRKITAVEKAVAINKMEYISASQIMILQLVSIVVGVIVLLQGQISVGLLVGLINCIVGSVFYPLMDLSAVISSKAHYDSASKRISEFLNSIKQEVKRGVYTANESCENELEINKLNFSFDSNAERVLSNINIKVKRGEIVSIFGASGSGKTTLINIIIGLYRNYEGSVTIKNLKKMSFMPQTPILLPISIKENIVLGNDRIHLEEVTKLLKEFALHEYINNVDDICDYNNKFSTGQAQRISLIRSAINNSSLLILDEPLASLDDKSKKIIMKYLQKIKENCAIIIVSHDEEIKSISDKVYFLKEGELVYV